MLASNMAIRLLRNKSRISIFRGDEYCKGCKFLRGKKQNMFREMGLVNAQKQQLLKQIFEFAFAIS